MKDGKTENTIFYRGTIFTISYFWDRPERDSFILAECEGKNLLFQIICISGYNSGTVLGYIKKGALSSIQRAITYEELVEGIIHNFLNPDLSSLKIENEYNIKFE
uniref:Uncharacterized protein n=2 Tax=unclassified Prevotella TaxID=2638335 RepID=A0AB33IVI6_9BACT